MILKQRTLNEYTRCILIFAKGLLNESLSNGIEMGSSYPPILKRGIKTFFVKLFIHYYFTQICTVYIYLKLKFWTHVHICLTKIGLTWVRLSKRKGHGNVLLTSFTLFITCHTPRSDETVTYRNQPILAPKFSRTT